MEESKALTKLAESIDLLELVEEILNPHSIERLSPAAWSGVRLTLKNARDILQASESVLSREFVNRSRQLPMPSSNGTHAYSEEESESEELTPSGHLSVGDPQKIQLTRRDLKASLERYIDR